MTVQYSTAVRMAILDAIEVGAVGGGANTGTGPSPTLIFYTGTKPTLCSDPIGAAVAAATLPLTGASGDYMSAATAAGNVVTKVKNPASTWTVAANPGGNGISFYRLWNTALTVCHEQGTVTVTGGGGDITLDSINVANGQTLTVTSKTLTAGNP